MIDLIKKTVLAGIGAVVISKEKVEDAMEDFVRQGKVKAEDAKIMADRIAEQGKREFEEISETLTAKIQEFTARSDKESKTAMAELEARIRILEAKLNEMANNRSSEP